MEDLWKEMFPFKNKGGGLDYDLDYDWKFNNLAAAFEEGGMLHGETVYLFRLTEAHQIQSITTLVPTIVAVVFPFPPSDMIWIEPVKAGEDHVIVPMREVKMEWVRYRKRDLASSQIFYLHCTQQMKALDPQEVIKYQLSLPYFCDPLKGLAVSVPILFPSNPDPVFYIFMLGVDNVEDVTEELVVRGDLSISQRVAFHQFLAEKVATAETARQAQLEEISEGAIAAYQNMRHYKFYPMPHPCTPNIPPFSKNPRVTGHYGRACQVL